jgi:hypothetical protein
MTIDLPDHCVICGAGESVPAVAPAVFGPDDAPFTHGRKPIGYVNLPLKDLAPFLSREELAENMLIPAMEP